MAIVKTAKFHGIEVTIEVEGSGTFFANVGPDEKNVNGKTLDEVEQKIDKILRRQTAAKPQEVTIVGAAPIADNDKARQWNHNGDFVLGEASVTTLTLRGYSDRTRELLVTLGSDRKAKLGAQHIGLHRVAVLRPLTPQEAHEYTQLVEAKRQALVAIEDFIGARKFDWETVYNPKESR